MTSAALRPLLVIETAEAACSAALIDDGHLVDQRHEIVGRGHAERLVPMLGDLLGEYRPSGVLVDCGPGSFTGLRVGIAAARAFGLAWSVPVLGFSSTAIIAAAHFTSTTDDAVAVVLMGGHGELFVEGFARAGLATILPLASLAPAAARVAIGDLPAIGSGAALAIGIEAPAWPRAADALGLPETRRTLPPRPIYVRPPDARVPS